MWAYCLNNPVAMVDSNGQETNWNTLLKVCTRILLARAAYWCIMLVNQDHTKLSLHPGKTMLAKPMLDA